MQWACTSMVLTRLPLMTVSRRRGCGVVVGATLPIAQGMKAMADRAVPSRSRLWALSFLLMVVSSRAYHSFLALRCGLSRPVGWIRTSWLCRGLEIPCGVAVIKASTPVMDTLMLWQYPKATISSDGTGHILTRFNPKRATSSGGDSATPPNPAAIGARRRSSFRCLVASARPVGREILVWNATHTTAAACG